VAGSVVHDSQKSSIDPDSSTFTQVRLLEQNAQPGVSTQVPQRLAASLDRERSKWRGIRLDQISDYTKNNSSSVSKSSIDASRISATMLTKKVLIETNRPDQSRMPEC
jgi:hypothetical protein